jgi:tRNA(Arg) A34 adenosine deaminase TadA
MAAINISDMHRSGLSILENFINDPRTVNMRKKHSTSIHKAVIVKRGIIIAEANNNYGSRSRGSGYSTSSIHAEKNVIKELGDISKLKGADMYVMRFTRNSKLKGMDQLVNSEPCSSCHKFLEKCMREYGLKNVYYTA